MTELPIESLLERERLVPLFHREDPAAAVEIALAVEASGLRLLEFTNRASGALSAFAQVAEALRDRAPSLTLGAGTVFDAATATAYIDRGARFIVAPVYDDGTREACHERGIPYLPGCLTPTEIRRAAQGGCRTVKLFPAGTLGPAHLRAVAAVFPELRFLPTGGIQAQPASVVPWLQAGAAAVGLGSDLIPAGLAPATVAERLSELVPPLLALRTSPDGRTR